MPDAVPPFDPGAPQNGAELAAALRRITCEGAHFLGTLPVEQFFAPQGDKWSPAEHVRHLRRSSAPLITAYRLPPWMLQLAFGSARRPSRSFDALRDDYRTALAAGGTAGRFAPSPESPPADRDRRRGEILMAWFVTNARVGTLASAARQNHGARDGGVHRVSYRAPSHADRRARRPIVDLTTCDLAAGTRNAYRSAS
jgi:hypothetical protein